MRKIRLIILFLFVNCKLIGQSSPPPMAMPADSNTLLVDKIIEVTRHEQYFIEYCTTKVKAHAQANGWSKEKTNKILGSIQFKYYNSTIYNSYSFYTTDQLKTLLKALIIVEPQQTSQTFILTNSMMQSNLDWFIESLIEGKYVTKSR